MSKQHLKQVSPLTWIYVDEPKTMSNKKQSSIEWLIEQVKKEHPFWTDTFEQAKAMHKDEQVNTFRHAQALMVTDSSKRAEQYYNETFGGDNE